jgi:hypothetical protein
MCYKKIPFCKGSFSFLIESYEDEKPCTEFLNCILINERFLHVVYAICKDAKEIIIVTAYEPDDIDFRDNFPKRIK